MTMADVFKILFIIVGSCAISVCYWLLFEALTPSVVERARKRYVEKPVRNLLLGIVFCGTPLLTGLGMAQAPGQLKTVGFGIVFALVLLGLMGSTGLVRHIGVCLSRPSGEDQPWRHVIRGGSVLSIACVLPFIGWFVLIPAVLVTGVGAAVVALWTGRGEKADVAAAS